MAQNAYTNAASGNPTNVYQVPELLLAADAVTVTDAFVKTIPVPKNKNETISLLRAVTPDANVTETAEGENPVSRALTYEQVTKTLEEFAEFFTTTSRQADLGERDVLMDSKDRLKDLMRRTREKNAWYEYRAANNAIYNSNAIVSRATVNGPISLGRLRVASRTIENNRGGRVREMTKGSLVQGTVPIEPAYVVFCHSDCKSDIRNLPGFVIAAQVGGAKERMSEWFGNCEDFMFICNPEFDAFLAGGAAIGATGMKSQAGVNIDVYTYLVFAKDSLGKCNLKGMQSEEGMGACEFYVLDKADKSDPTNQRRMVGARLWDGPVILNQNWVVAVEVGVTANPS